MSTIDRLIVKFMRRGKRQGLIAAYATGKTIDVGCSQGPNPLLPDGVVGFDMKEPGKLPRNYAGFVRGDAQELSKHFHKCEFDTVVMSELIEHVENPVKLLRECGRILKTGGRLIINTDDPYRFQTLLGNIFFPKGEMSSDEHVCYFPPRTLNKIARREGFRLFHLTAAEGVNLPLLRLEILYVYTKTKKSGASEV